MGLSRCYHAHMIKVMRDAMSGKCSSGVSVSPAAAASH